MPQNTTKNKSNETYSYRSVHRHLLENAFSSHSFKTYVNVSGCGPAHQERFKGGGAGAAQVKILPPPVPPNEVYDNA